METFWKHDVTGRWGDISVSHRGVGLLALARQLGNISQVCKILGCSRDGFYRVQNLYETGGEEALREIAKRQPVLNNRVVPEIE